MKIDLNSLRVGVGYGLRGYYAFIYDAGGPIQSYDMSYSEPDEAWRDAKEWSIAERIPLERRNS
jgi:hypothetical protein